MWATGIWDGTLHVSVRCLRFHVTCQIRWFSCFHWTIPAIILEMIVRGGGAGSMPGNIEDLWAPRLQFGCRSQTPKSVFCQLLFHLASKKVCGEQSVLSLSFRIGFFQDATSGTCVPRWGPQTLVDRGQQKDSFSPFFRWFQRKSENDQDPSN